MASDLLNSTIYAMLDIFTSSLDNLNLYKDIVTECSCNSGVLGGAPRSSLPGEFQNLRRQQKR